MKKLLIIPLILFAIDSFAGKYTPQMYQEALEPDATVADTTASTIVTSNAVIVPAPSDGKATYCVVIGSFDAKSNAQKLVDEIKRKGVGKPSISDCENGRYRVFYFTSESEDEARNMLQLAKAEYPAAWILKIDK